MDEPVDTQSAILASAASLLRQRTFEDISYQDLAEATDVSERTIYRRFPTRSHLLEALAHWIESEHFAMRDFDSLADFRLAVTERFRAFDAAPAFAFVAARGASLSPTADTHSSPTTAAIATMVSRAMPTLNRRDAGRLTASLSYFASAQFWARMRTGFEMSAAETSQAFDLALRSVLPSTPTSSWAA